MLLNFVDNLWVFRHILEEIDIEKELNLIKDDSQFTFVDGEEGDFGKIVYSNEGGIVATHVIEGGDIEHWEYTDYGKTILKDVLRQSFQRFMDGVLMIVYP